jgi:superfamily II DNA helicase RecQ
MPWSITDFAQESRRGGREGEIVDAVILVAYREVKWRL